MVLLVILGLLGLLAIYGIAIYNRLVRFKNMMEEGYSGIDVQLKKRYDLIPNLVNTVKGYASHEQQTFERVMEARAKAMSGGASGNIQEVASAQSELGSAMGRLFAVAENYPQLKADANFRQLQTELSAIEGDLEKARRYYNATVRDNNIAVETFPNNIVANMGGFGKGQFFELDSAQERNNPTVNFE
jgi:LemA protein